MSTTHAVRQNSEAPATDGQVSLTAQPVAGRPAWLPPYLPELQGLRGLAVLGVVLYHCHPLLVGTALYGASLWGWAGVNLFFVLSGFLITNILLESRGKPKYFRNFYARRALRIWPVYLLLLAVCYSVPTWFLGDTLAHQTHWKTLAAYALFLQNLRHTPLPGTLGPTWSLAIEEQYYLLWAPFVWLLGTRKGILSAVLCLLIVASPALRLAHPHWLTSTHTLIHLDGIALGSLLAVALLTLRLPQGTWLGIGGATAVAGWLAAATIAGGTAFLDSALALLFAGVVLVAIAAGGARLLSPLRRGPLAFLGTISYGLYMTHILVFVYFGSFSARLATMGTTGNLIIVLLRVVTSTLVATALWYGFESQILKLKSRF